MPVKGTRGTLCRERLSATKPGSAWAALSATQIHNAVWIQAVSIEQGNKTPAFCPSCSASRRVISLPLSAERTWRSPRFRVDGATLQTSAATWRKETESGKPRATKTHTHTLQCNTHSRASNSYIREKMFHKKTFKKKRDKNIPVGKLCYRKSSDGRACYFKF